MSLQGKHSPPTDPLVCVVVTRDHENFIGECLDSIGNQLRNTPVVVVDLGSRDKTVQVAHEIAAARFMPMHVIQASRENSSLQALALAAQVVESEWAVLISGDDALGIGYGPAAREVMASGVSVTAACFALVLVDPVGFPLSVRRPRWTGQVQRDQKKMRLRNLGTAPGCIVRWKILRMALLHSRLPDTLIEDQWIWWRLLEHGRILSWRAGSVLYRRHDSSLSVAGDNPRYSYSLGYSVGLAVRGSSSIDDWGRVIAQAALKMRHVFRTNFPLEYFRGIAEGSRSIGE